MSLSRLMSLIGIPQFAQHLVRDINLGRTEDDACVTGTVEHQLVTTQIGNIPDGGIDLLLNGGHEGCTLLEKLTLRTEVFLLQLGSLLLFFYNSILTGLLLLL